MATPIPNDVIVSPITNPSDFPEIYHCVSEAFGRQIKDAVWLSLNANWDTPGGREKGAAQMRKRWENVTKNRDGDPNTVFLKATLPGADGQRKVAGMAVWQQASFVPGYGDPPSDDLGEEVEELEPRERRFASQMFASLWKRRIAYTKEKMTSDPPAIFVLDMCAVDPAFQRRGVAGKLVEWGLEEAKRRGGLEATTEASSMGRAVYMRLGFRPEGEEDVVYEVDEEFRERDKPPNVFLRTFIGE